MSEQDLYQVARVAASPEQLQGNMFILTPDGAPVTLHWDDLDVEKLPRYVHIRIMAARDDNEEKWIEAFWPTTGEPLRAFDIRYARQFQLFAITVERKDAERIAQEGLSLRLDDGNVPLHLLCSPQNMDDIRTLDMSPSVFKPHIVNAGENSSLDEFYDRLGSDASVQPNDWTDGIILNGMFDLVNNNVLDRETIAHIFQRRSRLSSFASLYGRSNRDQILLYTMLAQYIPEADLLSWGKQILSEFDFVTFAPQSAYLHAYPLAILARKLNKPELAERALNILHEVSKQKLGTWSRDVGLYMLGLVRTLLELPTVDEELRAEVERLCAWVVQYQSKPGLWATYVDDLKTPPDTMGTAAIATALALAYTKKLTPTRYAVEVNSAVQVLKQFLTPDGFLTGAAPLYEDEALQRSDYRVISQVGMGFLAQLLATSKIFRA